MEVVYDTTDKVHIPVKLDFSFTDDLKQTELAGVNVFIWDKKWIDYNLYKRLHWKKLTSGKTYKFQFKKKGYLTAYRSVTIPPYHSNAAVYVGMEMETGTLNLIMYDTSCKVTLNYSRYCYSGTSKKKVIYLGQSLPRKIGGLITKLTNRKSGDQKGPVFSKELHLTPGDYEITIQKGKAIEYHTLRVTGKQTQSVTVDFKKETRKIMVTMN